MTKDSNWVFINSEPGLFTVGFYGPDKWHPESDHESRDSAANRVHFLNGGDDQLRAQRDELHECVKHLLNELGDYEPVFRGKAPETCVGLWAAVVFGRKAIKKAE